MDTNSYYIFLCSICTEVRSSNVILAMMFSSKVQSVFCWGLLLFSSWFLLIKSVSICQFGVAFLFPYLVFAFAFLFPSLLPYLAFVSITFAFLFPSLAFAIFAFAFLFPSLALLVFSVDAMLSSLLLNLLNFG